MADTCVGGITDHSTSAAKHWSIKSWKSHPVLKRDQQGQEWRLSSSVALSALGGNGYSLSLAFFWFCSPSVVVVLVGGVTEQDISLLLSQQREENPRKYLWNKCSILFIDKLQLFQLLWVFRDRPGDWEPKCQTPQEFWGKCWMSLWATTETPIQATRFRHIKSMFLRGKCKIKKIK